MSSLVIENVEMHVSVGRSPRRSGGGNNSNIASNDQSSNKESVPDVTTENIAEMKEVPDLPTAEIPAGRIKTHLEQAT